MNFGANVGALINASEGELRPTGNYKMAEYIATNPLITNEFNLGGSAFITGASIGYNHQLKVLVLGAETDFTYSTLNRKYSKSIDLAAPLSGTFNNSESEMYNWWGTLRARVGYAFKYPILIYATGGGAYGHTKSASHVTLTSSADQYKGSGSQWLIGYSAGAGVDWGFLRHWSMRVEYLFVQLRQLHYIDYNSPPPTAEGYTYHSELNNKANVIRLGFNYTL